MTRPVHVMIMAGGTGGHVFPALAVADALRDQGCNITWLGTRRGLEARVVPAAGYPIRFIRIQGLRGNGLLRWLAAPFKLFLACTQALWIAVRLRPSVVLGMGGFASGPGGMAAWLLRRPLVIHEQNAVAGMTNRLLSRMATVVLEAFPGSFAQVQAHVTGNPVRASIQNLPEPAQRFGERQDALRILVVGGSQGALVLNQVLPEALIRLGQQQELQVWHQCGERHLQDTQQHYHGAKLQVRLEAFIEDMNEAYAWADVVICRAGALTIAELTIAGVAAVLVPFPHAVDDHQTKNARWLVAGKAAVLLPQAQCTVEHMCEVLQSLLDSGREGLLKMAEAARQLARPEATARVAQYCLEAARG